MLCRPVAEGAVLSVWVQPRASRSELAGTREDALRVRLAAAPVDGEANAALLRLLAKRLGVPRSALELLRGQTGRRKDVLVRGLTPEEVLSRLGEG